MTDADLIGRSLLKSGYGFVTRNTQLDVSTATEQLITISEALETYVTQKGAGKPKTFKAAAQRACTYLVEPRPWLSTPEKTLCVIGIT
jgi:hypothetical protein